MKKNIFCLVLVLLFGFSGLSCRSQESEKTEWKTWSNSVFSLQYPPDWSAEEQGTNVQFTGPQENDYYVNLKVDYNSSVDMSVEDFMKTVEEQNQLTFLPDYIDGGVQSVQVGKQEALQRTLQTTIPSSGGQKNQLFVSLTYLVQKPSLGVVVTSECPLENYLQYQETLNKMLNSLRLGETVNEE